MEIAFSRNKIVKFLISSIIIVILFTYLELFPHSIIKDWSIGYKKLIALIAIVIGTAGIIINSKRLTLKYPGLIINDKGIVDNSSDMNFGLIQWKKITEIVSINERRRKFIVIHVEDYNEFIRGNIFKKALLYFYKFYYKSPILISANILEINVDKLESILLENFRLHKVPNS